MRLPLEKRIKRRKQLEMARMQDVLAGFAASLEKAVFHGGTAIWRVYGGRRFSEGLDFYLVWTDASAIKAALERALAPHGMRLTKFRETRNTLFIDAARAGTIVKLEFSRQAKKGYIIGNYERVDGSFEAIYTLSPEGLFHEKAEACLSRALARDLYDVIFLYPLCDKGRIVQAVRKLQAGLRRPADGPILKALVVEGLAPSFEDMERTIRRW